MLSEPSHERRRRTRRGAPSQSHRLVFWSLSVFITHPLPASLPTSLVPFCCYDVHAKIFVSLSPAWVFSPVIHSQMRTRIITTVSQKSKTADGQQVDFCRRGSTQWLALGGGGGCAAAVVPNSDPGWSSCHVWEVVTDLWFLCLCLDWPALSNPPHVLALFATFEPAFPRRDFALSGSWRFGRPDCTLCASSRPARSDRKGGGRFPLLLMENILEHFS